MKVDSKKNNPDYEKYPVGSLERLIHGCWQLGIFRFHAFYQEWDNGLQVRCDSINHTLGVRTVRVDLLAFEGDYRRTSQVMDIIRSHDSSTWIWFVNCEALLDSSLAGWLRSLLTTYSVEHVRVAFLLDNRQQYRKIFQRASAPFYQSTILLKI